MRLARCLGQCGSCAAIVQRNLAQAILHPLRAFAYLGHGY